MSEDNALIQRRKTQVIAAALGTHVALGGALVTLFPGMLEPQSMQATLETMQASGTNYICEAIALVFCFAWLTLDSHQRFDIAHPGFWQTGAGAEVAPFTPITAAQVRAGDFTPRDVAALPRTLAYLDALEAQGRYTLMVWPVHCEVGSWGHGIHADVLAACGDWQLQRQRAVRNVFKGTNPWTEHYSAIEAEVPDADDASTTLNTALLLSLGQADVLLIAGEASSHCVRSTTEHIVQHLPRLVPGWQASRIVLLTDGMSPVAGFEAQHQAFLDGMRKAGAQLASMHEISL